MKSTNQILFCVVLVTFLASSSCLHVFKEEKENILTIDKTDQGRYELEHLHRVIRAANLGNSQDGINKDVITKVSFQRWQFKES